MVGGGAAALAIVAGAAWLEHDTVETQIRRLEARLQHAPIPRVSGTIVNGSFDSKVLGTPVGYSLAYPRGTSPSTPLPVAFCLPGRGEVRQSVTGPDIYLAGFLGEAVDAGGRPFALAAVDGGDSYWHHRASGEDRMAMLVDEFIPMCHRRFRLGGDRGRRAAMGWSMGGYGVLLAAETYPDLLSSAVATSPAVWPTYADMMNAPGDAFDDAADFAAHDVVGHADRLAGTPLFIACGTADPFYPFVKQLAAKVPSDARVTFALGSHTSTFWRLQAPAELRFVAAHFG
jgi:S-formylglutathione hydrolase FrmB